MSETKTPRTDALIGKVTAGMNEPDDSEIVWLIDHARQLETELSAEQQARVAAETALRAWHSIFGTTQLSHAHAGFEAATERAERAEARAQELEKALAPFAALGGPDDGFAAAFHDLEDDVVIYENSGTAFTAGDVRAARKLVSKYYQPSKEQQ